MTVKLREKKEILHFEAQVELEEHITGMALTGFSSRFGADGYDLKVGGLAIECLSYHPLFPGKVRGSILEVAGFFSPPGGSEETSNNGRVKWAFKEKSDFPCKGLLKVLCISLRTCTVNRVVAMAIKFKVLQAVTWQLLHRRGLLLIWPFS